MTSVAEEPSTRMELRQCQPQRRGKAPLRQLEKRWSSFGTPVLSGPAGRELVPPELQPVLPWRWRRLRSLFPTAVCLRLIHNFFAHRRAPIQKPRRLWPCVARARKLVSTWEDRGLQRQLWRAPDRLPPPEAPIQKPRRLWPCVARARKLVSTGEDRALRRQLGRAPDGLPPPEPQLQRPV